jgi:hypothetical protein
MLERVLSRTVSESQDMSLGQSQHLEQRCAIGASSKNLCHGCVRFVCEL